MLEPVLVICDVENTRMAVARRLASLRYRVIEAENGLRALEIIRKYKNVPVAFLVAGLVDIGALDLIKELKILQPNLALIVLCPNNLTREELYPLLAAGADDYLPLEMEGLRLQVTMRNALYGCLLAKRNQRPTLNTFKHFSFKDFVTKSKEMASCVSAAKIYSLENKDIFIGGEEGAGRTALAHAIHENSSFSSGKFVVFSCLGNEETHNIAWQQELQNKIHQAKGGTLCLRDIDCLLKKNAQILQKYLNKFRVKSSKSSGNEQEGAFRLIMLSSTSYENLKQGIFRKDSFVDLLPSLQLNVPPLRRRRQDLLLIAERLLQEIVLEKGYSPGGFSISGEASALLLQYDWPLNVKELENVLFRAVTLAHSSILEIEDFPTLIRRQGRSWHMPAMLQPDTTPPEAKFFQKDGHIKPWIQIEKDALKTALKTYNWHMSKAAKRLGIGRSTLYRKIDAYQINKKN